MDQPLDLSQRDSDEHKRNEYNMDVEEPICSYQNCSCSLKHIMTLESPKRRDSPNKETSRCSPHAQFMGHQEVSEYDEGPPKRAMPTEMSSTNMYHPKKRKIEMYRQQQTLARSSSDNNLASVDDSSPVNEDPYRDYSQNDDVTYSGREKEESFYKPRTSPPMMRMYPEEMYMEQMSHAGPMHSLDYRMRTMSGSGMQRAPKKRHYSRHFSIETNGAVAHMPPQAGSYHQMMGHTQHNHLPLEHQRHMTGSGSRTKSQTASATITYSESQESKENELRERKIDLKTLKAEMIREIDNDPDTDDVPTFRKKLFETIMQSAKNSQNARNNPGVKPSALDYLITNKQFVPKNNHLNQIIRGEKPGKLCLMDIVELQVEIGLA